MNPADDFVGGLFKAIFEHNLSHYRQSLTAPAGAGEDAFANARAALSKLSAQEQEHVLRFISLAMADSVSTVFGTLDGTHFPDGVEGDFVLSCDGEEISGDLQDCFIGLAQDKGIY